MIDYFPYTTAPLQVGISIIGIDGDSKDELKHCKQRKTYEQSHLGKKSLPLVSHVLVCLYVSHFSSIQQLSLEGLLCARNYFGAEIQR